MARSTAFQFARVRPTGFRSIGSVTQVAPLLPGEGVKLTFTAAALTFQALWYTTPGLRNDLVERYVLVKTTADVHFKFGPVGMSAVTTGDALLQPGDAWQDFMTMQGDCGFDLIGDTAGGSFYLILGST